MKTEPTSEKVATNAAKQGEFKFPYLYIFLQVGNSVDNGLADQWNILGRSGSTSGYLSDNSTTGPWDESVWFDSFGISAELFPFLKLFEKHNQIVK
ncbi:hypothetical protein, partial [Mesomycoplasma ovipneumoniae]|uniref:hypothetical protein n=1 Tax=Mesomycoplasma ovipneumoniae TaxID=29562 RepID=UPI003080C61F